MRDVTTQHLQSYQSHLSIRPSRQGDTLTSGARHKMMGHIKGLFRYLYATGSIHQNPATNLVLPKKGRYLPRSFLSVDEMLLLLKQPDLSAPVGIRNRAILELLYSAALRNEEATMLETSDINLTDRMVLVHGKGGKDAVVPFGREAAHALENYLFFAREKLLTLKGKGRALSEQRKLALSRVEVKKDKKNDPLFISSLGYRISSWSIMHMVKKYVKMACITKHITPHCLRHTCATHLLRNGADIRHIQRLLRHGDISSTQIYTRVAVEDLKEAQKKYHPREQDNEQPL